MIKGENQDGIVVINDIVFKGKRNVDWEAVRHLKELMRRQKPMLQLLFQN